jgi:purine-binding chemotaxis protein CheW
MMQNVSQTGDIQIVNFNVDTVDYGVPVEQVREVRDMQSVTPVPGSPVFVEGVTNLRGQIITVMDLRKRLGLPQKNGAGEKIIIIDMGKHAVGIIVDSVTEVSTIRDPDIERNSEVTSSLDGSIIGVGKQGNHLTIILDLVKTITKVKEQLPETQIPQ